MHRLLAGAALTLPVVVAVDVSFGGDGHEVSLLFALGPDVVCRHDLFDVFVVAVVVLDDDGRLVALEVNVQTVALHVRLDAEPAPADVAQKRLFA